MKEIIPIKKDLLFKTIIGKITNIDLDHNYNIKDNIIEGNVTLSGSYKMTEASVLEDDFVYNIPFAVSISKKVNKDTIKIDIDDFKYEINKDKLYTEVDLLFTCEMIEEKEKIEFENPVEIKEENNKIEIENEVNEKNIIDNSISLEQNNTNVEENITNITNIVKNDNYYYSYKIYIVKENDSIDSICLKYNISINELKEYNDINEIHEGDKLIIPCINE